MVTYRKEMHIGAIVAVAMLTAHSLAAQGGAQQRRAPVAAVSAAASTDESGTTGTLTLQLAGDLLKTLAGKWRFDVRFAGNFTGAPDGSGTRVFASLFDSLRLEWRETLDSSKISAQGIMASTRATAASTAPPCIARDRVSSYSWARSIWPSPSLRSTPS